MPTPIFTDGIEVVNGDVIQADEINAIQLNTENLKARKLELGLLDTDDFANGFQEVMGVLLFSYTDIDDIDDHPSLTGGADGSFIQRNFLKDITITFPTPSALNDGYFLGNDFSDISFLIPKADSINITSNTIHSNGLYDYFINGYLTAVSVEVLSYTLTGMVVRLRMSAIAEYDYSGSTASPTMRVDVAGKLFWSAKGSY